MLLSSFTVKAKIINLTDEISFKELINQDGLVLVEFFSNSCVYCRRIEKELKIISKNNTELTIVKVDITQHRQLSNSYGIRGLPTLIYFKNGKLVKKAPGYVKATAIQAELNYQ